MPDSSEILKTEFSSPAEIENCNVPSGPESASDALIEVTWCPMYILEVTTVIMSGWSRRGACLFSPVIRTEHWISVDKEGVPLSLATYLKVNSLPFGKLLSRLRSPFTVNTPLLDSSENRSRNSEPLSTGSTL